MAKVIAILNQKGGVGKTTITANIGVALNKRGYRVLLVDSDSQASLRDWNEASEGELLNDDFSIIGLDRETLAKDVQVNKKGYDFVIIDGRAKAERMAGAAVKASDLVLIPVAPSALDVWGASDLVETIHARHEVTDGKPEAYFIVNNAKEGTRLIKEVKPAVEGLGFSTLGSIIHNREAYKQTMGEGLSVYSSSNQSCISEIEKLASELLEVLEYESEAETA